jgi:curli biogenesis system outer membrane secretion channel CsgG
MQVENKTAAIEQAASNEDTVVVTNHIAEVPVAALEEMLTTSLFNTNRFELTERKAIQTVLAEQDFGKSGRVSEQTAAKVGKILGANYMMFAAVNEWTPVKSRIGGAIGGYGAKILGAVGGGKTTAEIAMSFRIVDATSGKVLFSETVRAEAGSWGLTIGGFGGPGGGMGGVDRSSPIGYAVQSCLNKAAYKIAMFLKERSWTGTIVKVDGGKVYVNAGSDSGIVTGTKLIALAKGEAIVDPTTGLSLGDDTDVIGHLQVTTVKEKFSIATIVEGCDGLKKGDLVELAESGLTGTPLPSGGSGNP